MGYTHYFSQSRSFSKDEWNRVKDGLRKIVCQCIGEGIDLQFEYDDERELEISDTMIRFNGVDDMGHETFIVCKDVPKHQAWEDHTKPVFQFCKTARKPYDLAVCLSLLWIQSVAPNVLQIASDGGNAEWNPVRQIYQNLFGEKPPKIDVE